MHSAGSPCRLLARGRAGRWRCPLAASSWSSSRLEVGPLGSAGGPASSRVIADGCRTGAGTGAPSAGAPAAGAGQAIGTGAGAGSCIVGAGAGGDCAMPPPAARPRVCTSAKAFGASRSSLGSLALARESCPRTDSAPRCPEHERSATVIPAPRHTAHGASLGALPPWRSTRARASRPQHSAWKCWPRLTLHGVSLRTNG